MNTLILKPLSRNTITKAKNDLKECEKLLIISEANTKSRDKELTVIKAKHIKNLQEQAEFLKKTNNKLLKKMIYLTIITKAGVENIRKSMETLNEQNQYVESVNSALQRKDSLNLNFIVSLKRLMNDIPEEDLNMKVRKGLCIAIYDKILYANNNATLSQKEKILSRNSPKP